MGYAKPKRRLDPSFVQAVIANPTPRYILAQQSYFGHPAKLSTLIHSVVVSPSPLTVARLTRLAKLIGYKGEIFLPEVIAPAHGVDSFTAETLPEPSVT